jgi:hypothetical protein
MARLFAVLTLVALMAAVGGPPGVAAATAAPDQSGAPWTPSAARLGRKLLSGFKHLGFTLPAKTYQVRGLSERLRPVHPVS